MQDIHNKPTLETETENNEIDTAFKSFIKDIKKRYTESHIEIENYEIGNRYGHNIVITVEDLKSLNYKSFVEIAEAYHIWTKPLSDSRLNEEDIYEYGDLFYEPTIYTIHEIINCISDLLVKNKIYNEPKHYLEKDIDEDESTKYLYYLEYRLAYLFKSLEREYYHTSYEMMKKELSKFMYMYDYYPPGFWKESNDTEKLIEIISRRGEKRIGDMYHDIYDVFLSVS